MRKICFCIDCLNNGGAERVLTLLANHFSCKDDVTILLTSTNVFESSYTINSHVKKTCLYKEKKCNSFKKLLLLRRFFKINNFDCVISFLSSVIASVYLSTLFTPIKHIVSERNDPKYNPDSWFVNKIKMRAFKKASAVILQTSDAKDYYKKRKIRGVVIGNPLSEKLPYCDISKVKENTILAVGRLEDQKNYQLLLEAFASYLCINKDIKLLIYGSGSLKEKLETLAINLGISNNVLFMGNSKTWLVDNLNTSCFVNCSNFEGMSNSLLEALSSGLPCIATDCPIGGSRELIVNKENGLLIQPNNKSELVDAFQLLIKNKELVSLFNKNNRKYVNEYSLEKIGDHWSKIIDVVINENK